MRINTYLIIITLVISGFSSGLFAQAGKKTAKIAKEAAKEPVKEAPAVVESAPVTPEKTPQAVAFDNKYNWNMYFRANHNTIQSATAENSLKIENAFTYNRALNKRNVLIMPSTGQFTGMSYDFGFDIRHNWLFRSNWLFSGGSFADTSSSKMYFEQGTITISTFSSTTSTSYSSMYMNQFSDNTLKTGRIAYGAEFFPFFKVNPVLAKLSVRFGPELYANGSKLLSNYLLTAAPTATDFIRSRDVRYNEGFGNLFFGLSYSYEINNKHQLDFSADYFKSMASAGSYSDTSMSILQLSSSTAFPIKTKLSGSFTTNMSGYRFNVGYKFQIFENMGIRLSYGYWDATHQVTDSKITDSAAAATFLSNIYGANLISAALTSLPGFGPNPSSNDKRSQIGFEVVFRF